MARSTRSILKINEKVKMDSGIKAYRDGFISNPDRLAKFIEKFMQMFLDGKLDGVISAVENYNSSETVRTSQVNPDLKFDFSIKAYEDGLIKNTRYVARLTEDILRDYLDGKLDKILKDDSL